MYRLLIAEDETIERMALYKTLQKHVGELCTIYEAKNGREAVRIFQRENIQIAILDIEMPGMDGLEAARNIRQMDEDCVILFLTAFDKFSYAKQAISVRALDYLLKPYDEKELIFAVEEAMRMVDRYGRQGHRGNDERETIYEEKADNQRVSLVKAAIEQYIKNNYMRDITMHDAACAMNYSQAYFCKLFKQCFRVNFTAYLAEYRIEAAKKMLENPIINIKDVSEACGYTDSNYFTRVFKRTTGYTPTEYRLCIAAKETK